MSAARGGAAVRQADSDSRRVLAPGTRARRGGPLKQNSMQALRKFAAQLPDTEEGVACEGTALESRTVRTAGKAFLFLRPNEARLKLGASLKDAAVRASRKPDRYVVGSGGWVRVTFDDSTDPLRTRWWRGGIGRTQKHACLRGFLHSPARRLSTQCPQKPASNVGRSFQGRLDEGLKRPALNVMRPGSSAVSAIMRPEP
jgi:hypothetical protein